ncbi:MAG: BrnT family toxin [Ignavibacteriae bacterium]|nr:BrnT family toxin [Ignavibacteriota bacterium]
MAWEFEWDPKKAEENLKKHRISFQEASTVLGDILSRTIEDHEHSQGESRYITMGLSSEGRLLVVSHTDRGERIRIISARRAFPKEVIDYEEET